MTDRPRVLAVLPQLIPSTMITVVKPLTALHGAGRVLFDIAVEPWVGARRIERADVIVFSRNTERIYRHVLEWAVGLGKPVIYELDDNFFEVPQGTREGRYHRDPVRLAQLECYLKAATLVRVYSEPLRMRVAEFNPRVVRVDGAVDWSLLPSPAPSRDPRVVRIVYATSRVEDDLAAMFMEDLRGLLASYRGRVEVVFWGYRPPELAGHPSVRCLPFVRDYDRFFRRFARAGFDIGLAPLRSDGFHRSKSNNKFREYAACRIAGVYSDVDVYSTCVEDGRTGLLVPEAPRAWLGAVGRLVEDARLREEIQERAYRSVRERYTLEKAQDVWLEQIAWAMTHRRESPQPGAGAPGQGEDERRGPRPAAGGGRRPAFAARSVFGTLGRGIQLVTGVRRRGILATLQLARRYVDGVRLLLRVKWSLWLVSGRSRSGVLG